MHKLELLFTGSHPVSGDATGGGCEHVALLSHVFRSPAQQDQLLNNTDPSATASAQSPAVDEDEPRQSPQPPPASAAAESAKADIVTGPTEAAGSGSGAKFKVLARAFGIRCPLPLPMTFPMLLKRVGRRTLLRFSALQCCPFSRLA